MTTTAILAEAERRGIKLRTDGTLIYFRPEQAANPELLEAMRERKAELIAYLRRHESDGVGPWQPPGNPRRCPACGGGLQPDDPDNELCFTCRWPGAPSRIQ